MTKKLLLIFIPLFAATVIFLGLDLSRHDDAKAAPSPLSFVGNLSGAGAPNFLGGPNTLQVKNNKAYISSGGLTGSDEDKVIIVDITNPLLPVTVSTLSVDGARAIHISGNFAYVLSTIFQRRMTIIDLTVDLKVGSISSPVGGFLSNPRVVAVSGDFAYVGVFPNKLAGTEPLPGVSLKEGLPSPAPLGETDEGTSLTRNFGSKIFLMSEGDPFGCSISCFCEPPNN